MFSDSWGVLLDVEAAKEDADEPSSSGTWLSASAFVVISQNGRQR
jgi:hypothetical protein